MNRTISGTANADALAEQAADLSAWEQASDEERSAYLEHLLDADTKRSRPLGQPDIMRPSEFIARLRLQPQAHLPWETAAEEQRIKRMSEGKGLLK